MMRDTTLEYITKRAVQSGLVPASVGVIPQAGQNPKWDIEVVYNGKDDEIIHLWDTMYEVNILEWVAENVAIEATIEGTIDSEPHWWSVKLYPAGEWDGDLTEPTFERNEDEYGPVLCSANTGGDPASGCDELVTGHDMLCDEHRLAVYEMNKAGKEE